MQKYITLVLALILSTHVYAHCSFKIINDSDPHFATENPRGTIGNLLIPLCTQNPNQDPQTLSNCAKQPEQTLYMYPHESRTCSEVNNQPVFLQLISTKKQCVSQPQTTQGDVVLHYPADFSCQ